MKKYNIAFVPKEKAQEFITLCTVHTTKPHNYYLNEKSIPHLTICQFYLEEDNVDLLYDNIRSELITTEITLSFNKYSHLTFDENTYWLSVLPEEFEELNSIYICVSKIIKPLRSDAYDPHLTLFNYLVEDNEKNKDFHELDRCMNIQDEFMLVIGECDKVGQLTKIIKSFDNQYSSHLSLK